MSLHDLEDAARRFAATRGRVPGDFAAAGDHWPALCDLGAPGLTLPEDAGGLGLGAAGAMVLGRALGAQAVPVGFAAGAVLVPELLAQAGRGDLVAAIQAGERIGLAADMLPSVPGVPPSGLAIGPGQATQVMVLDPGVALRPLSAPDLELADGTPAQQGAPETMRLAPGRALSMALVAVASELLGAGERLFALTLDHLSLRRQFGAPLARAQALQFRMVDLSIALEEARALILSAAEALDGAAPDADARSHAAMARATGAARKMAEEAIQLHGAIGMTAESPVSVLVRAVLTRELLWGGEDCHLALFRAAGPVIPR